MYGAPVGTILVSQTSTSGYLISSTNTTTGQTNVYPTRVFHVTLVSNTGTNSLLQLLNGQGNSVELLVSGTSGSTRTIEVDYGFHGHTFTNGCYWTTDANLVEAAIVCRADLL